MTLAGRSNTSVLRAQNAGPRRPAPCPSVSKSCRSVPLRVSSRRWAEREGERVGLDPLRAQDRSVEPFDLRPQVQLLPGRDHVGRRRACRCRPSPTAPPGTGREDASPGRAPLRMIASSPWPIRSAPDLKRSSAWDPDVGRTRRHLQKRPHHLGQAREVDPLPRPAFPVAEQRSSYSECSYNRFSEILYQ